jgi:hypothetical protein
MNPRRLGPGGPLYAFVLAALPAMLPLIGCAASDASFTRGASDEAPNGDFGAVDAGAAPPSGGGGATDTGSPAPEVEVEGAFDTPAATGSVVWSANAISGRVTAIVAATLDRVTANAGNGPGNVVAIPGATDTAAVLNDLSNDATILRYASRRITTETVRTHETANAWAVAPSGPYAIAWTDASRLTAAAITQGFQELDVITTSSPAKATRLAVGYRPFAIAFDQGGTNAVVASRDGLTLIECNASGGPRVARHVPIAVTNRTGNAAPFEFALTPNGRHAVVRVQGQSSFDVLALDGSGKRTFTLAGPITDIDLSGDGSQVYAVVSRPVAEPDAGVQKSAFYTVAVDAPQGTTPTKIELPLTDLASTSVSANGTTAVFYTNGIDLSRVVVMGLVGEPSFRTVELYAPVLAVFPAPNGEHALALHKPSTSANRNLPVGAFSLVPLKSELPSRIIATPGKVSAVATSPASDRFVVLERSDDRAAYAMHVAEVPVLTAKRYELASPPTAVGIVPAAQRAFAAQVHPQGRISFVDLPTGLVHTLTGFELGAR